MNDTLDIVLAQWFQLEAEARAAQAAADQATEDLNFYAQQVKVSAEQAEVAPESQLANAIWYLKDTVRRLEEVAADQRRLEEAAADARRKADLWKAGLKSVATF